MDTPQQQLEQACRDLDVQAARSALAMGADANQETQDGTPLPVLVVDSHASGECLEAKAKMVALLFGAGAGKNPYSKFDGIVSCGIETLIERALDRLGEPGWDEDREIGLLEAWLEAGNDPNPMVAVDGRVKPLIRSIGFMFDEMKQWTLDNEEAMLERSSQFIFRIIGVLHIHGCPLTRENLDEAGFDAGEVDEIIARAQAQAQSRRLDAGTCQPDQATGRASPRI